MAYYAVANGRNNGIYTNWTDCNQQVCKFPKAKFKKFNTKEEAENYIREYSTSSSSDTKNLPKRNNSPPATNTDSDDTMRSRSFFQNGDKFIEDEDGYVIVYTDGSCIDNGYRDAKAGIGVWFSDNNSLNISQPVEGRATNNNAEIQAVTMAARQAESAGFSRIKICTDSQFLISCVTEWMPAWKKRNWKTCSGNNVINKEELLEMEEALENFDVKWYHVRGHNGNHGNEMADRLARQGAEYY